MEKAIPEGVRRVGVEGTVSYRGRPAGCGATVHIFAPTATTTGTTAAADGNGLHRQWFGPYTGTVVGVEASGSRASWTVPGMYAVEPRPAGTPIGRTGPLRRFGLDLAEPPDIAAIPPPVIPLPLIVLASQGSHFFHDFTGAEVLLSKLPAGKWSMASCLVLLHRRRTEIIAPKLGD